MQAERLLLLYPRGWRDRYGDEFLATVGDGPLTLQQAIDIVSAAIDAWLSADVRRATMVSPAAHAGGLSMVVKSALVCHPTKEMRFTTRDSLVGSAVMIGATLCLTILGIAARRSGWPATAEALTSVAFPASLTLSMPFWLMKGEPWKAQLVIVGGTLALLASIGVLLD
jgi:hypothetical protein